MANDYYGFSKEVHGPDEITSTAAVLVRVGGGQVKLAQSATVEYNRDIKPQYELGSYDVYYTVAPASGTCRIERIVGDGTVLEPFKPDDPCEPEKIFLQNKDAKCSAEFGTVTMEGLLSKVGITANVQSFTVTDEATYEIGSLSVD